MGLTMLTALEIFSNPYDLQIFMYQKEGPRSKWAFTVHRGPGHAYKPLVSTIPFFRTAEKAAEEVHKILDDISTGVRAELVKPDSFWAKTLNPDGQELDGEKVLNAELIERIIRDLKTKNAASTHQYKRPV